MVQNSWVADTAGMRLSQLLVLFSFSFAFQALAERPSVIHCVELREVAAPIDIFVKLWPEALGEGNVVIMFGSGDSQIASQVVFVTEGLPRSLMHGITQYQVPGLTINLATEPVVPGLWRGSGILKQSENETMLYCKGV